MKQTENRGRKGWFKRTKNRGPKGWFKRTKNRGSKGWFKRTKKEKERLVRKLKMSQIIYVNEPKTEKNTAKNNFFLTDIFFPSVKYLSSDPRDYPQVTFNKRLEGYHTVPSAVPKNHHAVYAWVGEKQKYSLCSM